MSKFLSYEIFKKGGFIVGFDFLENTAIYRAVDCGGSFDLIIPGGVVTITDPGEISFIRKTLKEAAKMSFDHKETMRFLRFNLLVKY